MSTTHAASRPPPAGTFPRRRDDLRVELVAGGHVLHEANDAADVHLLNETAFALWQLCDGRTSPEEMAAGVSQLFGRSGAAALDDVDRTLAELAQRGLIAWAAGSDGR